MAWLTLAACMAVSLLVVAGFFGSLHPAFDSLANLRLHLAAALGLTALPLLATPLWRQGLGAVALSLGAASTALSMAYMPGIGPAQAALQPRAADSAIYRLIHLNLRFDNATPEQVLSMIGRMRPDVLTLNEVSAMWAAKLDLLSSAYPYRLVCDPPGGAGGVAILSARPFADGESGECFDGGTMAVAAIDLGGRTVDVGAVHMHWPWPFGQAGHIDRLADGLGGLGETALLAGDLNATPWSVTSARIAALGGLTRVGPSGPTWLLRRLPDSLRFAGLPIDQIFAKGAVIVHSAKTLEPVGSDHLPVLVEFSLAPPPPPVQSVLASAR